MTEFDDEALDSLIKAFGEEEIKASLGNDLTKYQQFPVEFFHDILKIEHVPDKIIEMAESVRDFRVTIAQSCTGFGKTFFSAALAIWMYKCFPESQVIMTSAPPELNLVEKLWQETTNFVFKNKKLFKKDRVLSLKITDNINLKEIEDDDCDKSPRHIILGRAIPSGGDASSRIGRFSGFHQQTQMFVCDEGDQIYDEIYEAIDGCMSGSFNRLLIIFNPKKKNGAVWEKIDKQEANVIVLSAFDHPNVISGEEIIPGGAVSRQQTLQRILTWTEELKEGEDPDSNCFEIPDFLVGAIAKNNAGKELEPIEAGWRRITNSAFSYIVLGTYPSVTENSLFNEVDINNAISRWKLYKAQYGEDATKGLDCLLGMDVADQGSDSCVVAKRYGNFIDGFIDWKGVDLDRSSDRLGQIYADLDAHEAFVEADGIGAAIPPKVSRMFYWKCENKDCPSVNKTYLDEKICDCPVCHKNMTRKHMNVRKVYVSSPSNKKCDMGRLHLVRDELAWGLAEWLKKEPSAMLPDDPDLKKQMMCFEYWEDQNSGKIKVSDKKAIRKKLNGKSPDKFAALVQCFYEQPVPRVRVI
ncbi:MAG: DEAD/DEAH box helicase family protein [Candidatus Doudnabacteria bacterium]